MRVSGGSLPAGLTITRINPSTFTISGTATGASKHWFRVIFSGPGWSQLAYYSISSAH